MTLRAVRALQSADIVLYDDLVSREILAFARREARTLLVGKAGHGPACRQEAINELMLRLARQGRRVVRLKGGDPGIFARAAEEIEACQAAGVPVEIVPGISAAQAAAAALRVPLTSRDRAKRVQFVTGHDRHGGLPSDLDYAALADPRATTCVYMGWKTAAELARRLLAEGLPAATPVVCMSNVSRKEQSVRRTTVAKLAEGLAPTDAPAPMIMMIGPLFGAAAPAAFVVPGIASPRGSLEHEAAI